MSLNRLVSSAPASGDTEPGDGHPRVVVVEDEHIVALDIRMHLSRNGYEVPALFDAAEDVLEYVKTDRPDLVLMDIKLNGEMDGIEAAERLRVEHDIPVILLTAYADESTINRAKTTRPFAYIIKPFEEQELRTAITISLYRHEVERKLAEREQLFETTLNSIGDAVVVVNESERVQFLNPPARRLIDRAQEDCIGAAISDLFTIADREQTVVDHRLYRGDLIRSDGSRVPVEHVTTKLRHTVARGEGDGAVWVIRDIAERLHNEEVLRNTEAQLRHAQKMEAIGRLSSGLAHDFNNVLTVVLGYAKLVRDTLRSDGTSTTEVEDDLDGIQAALGKAATLTRQLLSFSRDQHLEMRVLNLNGVVQEAGRMIRRLVSEHVSVQMSLSSEFAPVRIDQTQMEQILLNLAVNARDAMPDGGTLLIRTDHVRITEEQVVRSGRVEPGDYIVLKMRDTGVGMDAQILDRVFEPFFTTKPAGKGTGLGLATTYGLVQQWGGYLDVESRPGKGSLFRIYLPRSAEEPEQRVSDESVRRPEYSGTETVLLVDEDETLRNMLSRFLRDSGYLVLEARNSGEALLVSESFPDRIHLLVAEVALAHLSGPRLFKRLRESRPGVSALFVASGTDNNDRDLPEAGPVLAKPFEPGSFLQEVRSRLDA